MHMLYKLINKYKKQICHNKNTKNKKDGSILASKQIFKPNQNVKKKKLELSMFPLILHKLSSHIDIGRTSYSKRSCVHCDPTLIYGMKLQLSNTSDRLSCS